MNREPLAALRPLASRPCRAAVSRGAVGRVAVGMSGGVDSSVAAALLKAEGYDVIGLTLKIWEDEGEERKAWKDRSCCKVGLAKYIAEQLDIPHHVVEAREAFQDAVIKDFSDQYLQGRTPNPCVRCNERVKFGMLLQAAEAAGADTVATGHYAMNEWNTTAYSVNQEFCNATSSVSCGHGRWLLKKAVDMAKDQTYFLYRLNQAVMSRTIFPLGGLTKREVWAKAAALGFPADEMAESQEVCFVTQRDYRGFLEEEVPEARRPGLIVTEQGESVGEHRGIAFYTVGQRRGLGIAGDRPLYVTALDAIANRVVVGEKPSLYRNSLIAGDLNLIAVDRLDGPLNVTAKIRSHHPETPARIEPFSASDTSGGQIRVVFETPQRAVSPGQSVVFYQGDVVVGGGIIQES